MSSPGDSKPIYANPAQVSVVDTYKGEPPDTMITFRKEFLLGEKESRVEVVAMLEEVAGETAAE